MYIYHNDDITVVYTRCIAQSTILDRVSGQIFVQYVHLVVYVLHILYMYMYTQDL